jgi:hypothetical protein
LEKEGSGSGTKKITIISDYEELCVGRPGNGGRQREAGGLPDPQSFQHSGQWQPGERAPSRSFSFFSKIVNIFYQKLLRNLTETTEVFTKNWKSKNIFTAA